MWLALLANAAPLVGIVLWLTPFSFTGGGGWDFAKLFTIGLYMTFAGLVVPAVIWVLSGPGLAKTEALSAVKFHAVIAAIVLGFVATLVLGLPYDPPDPGTGGSPRNVLAVMTLFFAACTFVLPIVELVRVTVGVQRVLKTS